MISTSGLKRYEDSLDALVCACVGAKYLEGSAVPYGDNTAAIWVP
jgi:predicted RNase H-like nuclease